MNRLAIGMASISTAAAIIAAPTAHADDGWLAVANSPNHEQVEHVWGINQADAEARALGQCAALERANDCVILASGPECVALAWDVDEPINHVHAVSGGGRDVVLPAALAAAGPQPNDPWVGCTWDPR